VKLFVVGVACSGKSTICKYINSLSIIRAIDIDDEIMRLNGGIWPEISYKNEVIFPQVVKSLLLMENALIFNSFLHQSDAKILRNTGFTIALLSVPSDELRRRDQERQMLEGWSNSEWFEWNQAHVHELKESGLVDVVIDGNRPVELVARDLIALFN
jgi:shikimate kinase